MFLLRSVRGWLVIIIMVLVAAVPLLTARLFVWPPTDPPSRADAVVALGGDTGQLRQQKAIMLARAGYAPVAVVSLGGTRAVPCPSPVHGIEIVCFRAHPLDTRGEAEYVSALAARRHWRSLILVSERSQATRARMLFERCTGVRLIVVPVTDPRTKLFYDVAYEWAALTKALVLQRSC